MNTGFHGFSSRAFDAIERYFDTIYSNLSHTHAGGGGSSIFARVLTDDLTLADTESLVSVEYIQSGSYTITLNGDSAIEIL